ncbi:MAG TPA: response regulator [Elusimicrobiota bacterium]|jgi:DNA-binding response OmpR family regulator|nr:response regulator [Elusimicrobiota bacterium]
MAAGRRRTVVLVDDDADFQSIVAGWLRERYDVVALRDGEEMEDELPFLHPDLVILDVGLPGPDGFRLCARIRADERFAGTPVLFVTACADKESYLKHLEVGGAALLGKPLERAELLAQVGRLLGEF